MNMKLLMEGRKMDNKVATAKTKQPFLKKVKKNYQLLTMLIPSLLMVIVFSYIPMGGIVIAFKKYNYSARTEIFCQRYDKWCSKGIRRK